MFYKEYIYYTFWRVVFFGTTAFTIYLMKYKKPICLTYDKAADDFNWKLYLIAPCSILAVFTTRGEISRLANPGSLSGYLSSYLTHFSMWVETVAIWPQLKLLMKLHEVENITSDYVVSMGAYRVLYLLAWGHEMMVKEIRPDKRYFRWVCICCWIAQSALYSEIVYYYVAAKYSGEHMVLPFSAKIT